MIGMFNYAGSSRSGAPTLDSAIVIPSMPYTVDASDDTASITSPEISGINNPYSLPLAISYAKEVRLTYSASGPEGGVSGIVTLARINSDEELADSISDILKGSIFFEVASDSASWDDESTDPGSMVGSMAFSAQISGGQTNYETDESKWGITASLDITYSNVEYLEVGSSATQGRITLNTALYVSDSAYQFCFGTDCAIASNSTHGAPGTRVEITGSCQWEIISFLEVR